jgi:5-deoxy-glucuronate isomerase
MKSRLHIRPTDADENGRILHITPQTAGWQYVGFDVYRLMAGQSLSRDNIATEVCAVVLSGAARFEVDSRILAETAWRNSPFDPNPWALYAPLGATWKVTALEGPLELAIGSAPAQQARAPRVIRPEDLVIEKRGSGTNTRYVADFLPQERDVADKLLVLEAITPAGNWSSYPPHKHDEDRLPKESKLEEVYYHHISPASGFAMQRVYTGDGELDESISVCDGDVVLVPRGYHPVGAPHGYDLYYLNVMAGPRRIWRTHTDPAHAWLLAK